MCDWFLKDGFGRANAQNLPIRHSSSGHYLRKNPRKGNTSDSSNRTSSKERDFRMTWGESWGGGASGKEPACQCKTRKTRESHRWVGKIPLRRATALSSILAWRIPMGRGAWWATLHSVARESETTESLNNSISESLSSLQHCLLPNPKEKKKRP